VHRIAAVGWCGFGTRNTLSFGFLRRIWVQRNAGKMKQYKKRVKDMLISLLPLEMAEFNPAWSL
jgi:hypothetical protein